MLRGCDELILLSLVLMNLLHKHIGETQSNRCFFFRRENSFKSNTDW